MRHAPILAHRIHRADTDRGHGAGVVPCFDSGIAATSLTMMP
ncbi:MAG TPA: hypothetical protein VFJ14_04305 [Nocardioidaceae bacterium]|nr:hypothetical protein [Nocardioidaceae bacterium]